MRHDEPVSTDFHVGQRVICKDPEWFISSIERYLTGRVGVVETVYPVTRPPNTLGRFNEVAVRWLKKGNRGKEEVMILHPSHLLPEPVADEQP